MSETLEERVARDLDTLRELGIVKKQIPTITRSTFERLSPQEKKDFLVVHGGKFEDDPAPEKRPSRNAQPLPKGAIRRSTFDAMPNESKFDFFRKGGQVVDDEDVAGPNPSNKTLTRAEYNEMRMVDQCVFLEGGGRVVD